MPTCLRNPSRLTGLILDIVVGLFVLGLVVMIWLPTRAGAKAEGGASKTAEAVSSGAPGNSLMAVQGTPIVATINGSIDGTESFLFGRRHFRSGIRGDRNCRLQFLSDGIRPHDVFRFVNLSPAIQRVSVGFTSGCGNNTYMVAYSPEFTRADLCQNYVAGAGVSGSVNWDFTVCANSQFSIVVYALETGLTCANYSFTIYADNAVFLDGPITKQGSVDVVPSNKSNELAPASMDAVLRKHRRKIPGTDTRFELVAPGAAGISTDGLLPALGTPPPVAVITDSLSPGDPTFTGPRHNLSGIPGDGNCVTSAPIGTRFYDEVFFRNNSSNIERVEVQFSSSCGFNTAMAAYSQQFNPNNICDRFIASSGFSGSSIWSFSVCPNTQFSIVVYAATPGNVCGGYTYLVNASTQIALLGTSTDLSITKSGPADPVMVGSNINYNITFANNGPGPATGVVFSDPLPGGTTFVSLNLLSNFGTAVPPLCTTPPVGSGGTVSCSLNLLGIPGTGLLSSISYALTVNVLPSAGTSVVNTAFVSHLGFEVNPNNNSSSVTTTITRPFNLCLQDDSSRSTLQLSSITGDYLFTNCQGVTVGGRGAVTIKGSVVTLEDVGGDRRILARIDLSVMKGTASIQLFSPERLFTITDRNTADNTCLCP
jgi:uncharacterized repeat protein (TIGR01451 family)